MLPSGGREAVRRKWDPALSNNNKSQRGKRNGLASVVSHDSKKRRIFQKGKVVNFPHQLSHEQYINSGMGSALDHRSEAESFLEYY